MGPQTALPESVSEHPGQVVVLEAPSGPERRALLASWLEAAGAREGASTWLLDCDFERGGVWAGIRELFEQIVPRTAAVLPALAPAHDYELAMVSPALRRSINVKSLSLTDLATPEERVRLFPAERALRIVHGLVDLIVQWKQEADPGTWVIACDNFDRAGYLVSRFFSELLRRCGEAAGVALLAAGDAGVEPFVARLFADHLLVRRSDLQPGPVAEARGPEIAEQARALERQVADDELAQEERLQDLIDLWRRGGDPDRSLHWQFITFATYTYRGFYHDALRLGDVAFTNLRRDDDTNELRFRIINKLVSCYCAIDQPEKALELIETHGLGRVQHPVSLSYLYYLLAMLHVRYLPNKDLDLGAEYLEKAYGLLETAEIPEGDRHFQLAFNRNGLALIRHRQKRSREAIQLCEESYRRLNEHLAADKHWLHRSVLIYNIAQVYAAVGEYEEAIRRYTETLAIDENYSEYYNERGNAHFNLGHFEEALADYRRAMELSPPYPEVLINAGQCHRAQGRWAEAARYYGMALDLDPAQHWVYVMRAECHEAAESLDEAVRDYDAALAVQPEQPQILANRACLHYQRGDLARSLADLDRALALSPDNAELYQNRAVALCDLDRVEDALGDLETYLKLRPEAEDRPQVLNRIANLQGSPGRVQTQVALAAPGPA
jgi:tetratricopeptide (TPR) repeat protein